MRALKILFYSIVTLVVIAFVVGRTVDRQTIKGEGPVVTSDLSVDGFDQISVAGGWEVYLTPGETHELSMDVQENVREHVSVNVDGHTLRVETKGHLKVTERMKLYISAPSITGIEVSGATILHGEAPVQGEKLSLEASGASHLYLACEVQELKVDVSGASEATIEGTASTVSGDISGASQLNAAKLTAAEATLDASGASRVEIHVTETLHAEASGAANIRYSGQPVEVTSETSGAGKVSQVRNN